MRIQHAAPGANVTSMSDSGCNEKGNQEVTKVTSPWLPFLEGWLPLELACRAGLEQGNQGNQR